MSALLTFDHDSCETEWIANSYFGDEDESFKYVISVTDIGMFSISGSSGELFDDTLFIDSQVFSTFKGAVECCETKEAHFRANPPPVVES